MSVNSGLPVGCSLVQVTSHPTTFSFDQNMSRGPQAYQYSLECLDTAATPEGSIIEPSDIIWLAVRSVYTSAGGSDAHSSKLHTNINNLHNL